MKNYNIFKDAFFNYSDLFKSKHWIARKLKAKAKIKKRKNKKKKTR